MNDWRRLLWPTILSLMAVYAVWNAKATLEALRGYESNGVRITTLWDIWHQDRSNLSQHKAIAGHAVMEERVGRLERRIERLEQVCGQE